MSKLTPNVFDEEYEKLQVNVVDEKLAKQRICPPVSPPGWGLMSTSQAPANIGEKIDDVFAQIISANSRKLNGILEILARLIQMIKADPTDRQGYQQTVYNF